MFAKLLIANRGEIACRVMRTARRMGIATVAVYSEADAGALHVALADEARLIGPPPARQSYLDAAAIVEAARLSGAEAVHPGYGFLSENAEFAEACAAAGLVFVGPPPAAIRAMGSKAAAKALMQEAGVPVVPGYHGDEQDPDRLLAEAQRIGFPVLIKASAGGGGRGMRIVEDAAGFARALDGARREAQGAFGDDRVLLERYLKRPRHIEIQVFADAHGNALHLFERDCSLQRRYQKVVEEAPAPGMDPARRQAMGEAAVAAARAVAYVGAGTVEFIAEGDAFYFMEMNTRLQVEHPVTEFVTGLDLVEWQLRIAAGERLPLRQEEIALRGHAIEARLYAENPERGFLPATGTLHGLRFAPTDVARIDTGVRQDDRVTPYYDPLIAKIVVWGEDRGAALNRLSRALGETAVLGVATNLAFLRRVATHPAFRAGPIDTGFIAREAAALLPPAQPLPDLALAAAALVRLRARDRDAGRAAAASGDPYGPWARNDGWRPGGIWPQRLVFHHGEEERTVEATRNGDVWRLALGERSLDAALAAGPDGALAVVIDGVRHNCILLEYGEEIGVTVAGDGWLLREIDPLAPPASAAGAAGRLTSPMPGRVVQVLAAAGDSVRRGQPLLVVEAMKMEHTIAAPRDGVVATLRCAVGDLVEEGAELIALAPLEAPPR